MKLGHCKVIKHDNVLRFHCFFPFHPDTTTLLPPLLFAHLLKVGSSTEVCLGHSGSYRLEPKAEHG